MNCVECGTAFAVPKSVKTVSCRRCGCTHFADTGNKFYPALSMHPIDTDGGVTSMWMLPYSRPIIQGLYECRFRHCEPDVVTLRWDGARFVAPRTGERIAMEQFMSWRGALC